MSDDALLIMWLVAGVALLAVEMFVVVFISLYFGLGALAAALAAWLGVGLLGQLVTFAGVSLVLLLLTRPWLMRKWQTPHIPSNAQTIVGRRGLVTIEINNDLSTGQIRIGTEYWTARTPDDDPSILAVGEKVEVVSVAGVTARVRQVPDVAPADPSAAN
jgi:membrane protein implicated in regulation of membrane protease activity